MNYSLSHLADATLVDQLKTLVARDRVTTADLLAHIAEVDERRLYAAAGHPSMTAYCIRELRMSDDAASKRIHAARTARRFPAIFAAVAQGSLNVSGVVMLAAHLTSENTNEILSAAAGRTRDDLEFLIAKCFPSPDLPARVTRPSLPQGLLTATVEPDEHAPGRVRESVFVKPPETPQRVAPRSEDRYGLQCMIGKRGHELMRYAQALLGPRVPPGDIGTLVEMGFAALVRELEKKKFAATDRPRRAPASRPTSHNPRHIPADVKKAVWLRDQGRCAFVSESGHRCECRSGLQYDHIEPVGRGGKATIGNLRLRCHAHNQYEAERTFGVGFMQHKRETAMRVAASNVCVATREASTSGRSPRRGAGR